MKTRYFTLIFALLHGLVFAAGPPISEDRTRCEAPHYLVTLNEEQLEEVTVMGTLTLTRTQWTELRAKSPGMPKRIETILPSTYNDCSCGLEGELGIWFKNGTVAVVLEYPPTPFSEWPDERKNESCKNMQFRMDARGQFYQDGRLVRYEEVKARTAWVPANASHHSIGIDIPPHLDATTPALAGRLAELKKIAEAAGRDFWVFWLPIEPEE